MKESDKPVEQPKHTLLTGFTHFDYKEQECTPKYLKDSLYCHKIDKKYLLKGFLPRCRLLEEVFNYSKCSTSVSDIFFPPDFPAPKKSKNHTEYKLANTSQLISYLNFWINEKVEPENKIFWFYAYSTSPCKRRFALIENLLGDLITEFNFNNPAIATEIKELTKELRDKVKEWDDYNDLAKQTEQWIDPHHSRYSLFEVKEAAASLIYKLQHVGSMVREEQKPPEEAGQGCSKNEKTTGSCWWRLYETTLKVLVDAFLERFWPKPK